MARAVALSDAELAGSGIPFTILKPHSFMQNLLMAAQSVAQQGAMYFANADGKMGVIDSRNISDFAAHVLTTAGHEGKTYTITGPAPLSMHQISTAKLAAHAIQRAPLM